MVATPKPDPSSVAQTLGLGNGARAEPPHRFKLPLKILIWTLLLIAIIVVWYFVRGSDKDTVRYLSEDVTRGDLIVSVSATGNLQPTTQVDVGSELSGTIEEVLVNDNDKIKKGQTLARLDTSKLEDQALKSEATLMAARANVTTAEATVNEASSNLDRLNEAWKLSDGKIPSKSDLTSAEAALKRAMAEKASAEAAVKQAEATLRADKTNLTKARIISPIDGVVLLRKIEPGQTVAASLQAPVLFVLAQNLSQMQLQVNIDEADVGQVKEGQSATFTVDAYPQRTFPATIKRVRYGSETTNGVVTYQGVLEVANDDLSLRPGMTATANITTLERDNALLVPNAALRFRPVHTDQTAGRSSVISTLFPRPARNNRSKSITNTATSGTTQTVWVLKNGQPVAVAVTVGATNGKQTEILAGELKEGDKVITDSETAS